jgi:2-iminobutanoate/2-iminopropanoate deaminase
MDKKIISTDKAPAAIGPYSQAIVAGGFVFCSGQIPIDPATGQLLNSSVTAATERVLLNLEAVLGDVGLNLNDIVRTTVYLSDMENFTAMNDVYAIFFRDNKPARATVQASLPRGSLVEIDAIALAK